MLTGGGVLVQADLRKPCKWSGFYRGESYFSYFVEGQHQDGSMAGFGEGSVDFSCRFIWKEEHERLSQIFFRRIFHDLTSNSP